MKVMKLIFPQKIETNCLKFQKFCHVPAVSNFSQNHQTVSKKLQKL